MLNFTDAADEAFNARIDAQFAALTYTAEEIAALLRLGVAPEEVAFHLDGSGLVSPAGLRELANAPGVQREALAVLEVVPDFSFWSPAPGG